MVRVLVALSPRMYREATAFSILWGRPGLEVRVAAPAAAGAEIERFRPHLLVHNDTAPIAKEALSSVPYRLGVLYSDSMEARLCEDGRDLGLPDASTDDLLRAVNRAAAVAG